MNRIAVALSLTLTLVVGVGMTSAASGGGSTNPTPISVPEQPPPAPTTAEVQPVTTPPISSEIINTVVETATSLPTATDRPLRPVPSTDRQQAKVTEAQQAKVWVCHATAGLGELKNGYNLIHVATPSVRLEAHKAHATTDPKDNPRFGLLYDVIDVDPNDLCGGPPETTTTTTSTTTTSTTTTTTTEPQKAKVWVCHATAGLGELKNGYNLIHVATPSVRLEAHKAHATTDPKDNPRFGLLYDVIDVDPNDLCGGPPETTTTTTSTTTTSTTTTLPETTTTTTLPETTTTVVHTTTTSPETTTTVVHTTTTVAGATTTSTVPVVVTTPSESTPSAPPSPLPNTGGGGTGNWLLIAVSSLLAGLGIVFTTRRKSDGVI